MYDFLFFFIYSQQIQKGKSETFSRLNGSLIAGITLEIHILFILSILRKIFFQSGQGYGLINKNIEVLIVVLIIILAGLYYNQKRVEKIKKLRNGNLISITTINIVKMLLLIFVPLFFVLRFSLR